MVKQAGPQLTTAGTHKIILEGQTISYTVRRSPRARHIRLEISTKTGLTVVIPKSHRLVQVPDLLRSKKRWVLDKLRKYGEVRLPSHQNELKTGDVIPYLGRNLELIVRINCAEPDSVHLEKNRIIVNLTSRNPRLNLALEGWYRRQAEKLIGQQVELLCSRLGVSYGRLTIRQAKTRWGSCSQKGNLNFNWRLIMAPEPIIDYIIIHELAHLKELNHTKRFWQLVAEYCPRWREHRRWLKDHEAKLSAILPF